MYHVDTAIGALPDITPLFTPDWVAYKAASERRDVTTLHEI